jgi:hypothetical protein
MAPSATQRKPRSKSARSLRWAALRWASWADSIRSTANRWPRWQSSLEIHGGGPVAAVWRKDIIALCLTS